MTARLSGFSFVLVVSASIACSRTVQTGSPLPSAQAYMHASSGSVIGVLNFNPSQSGIHITGTLTGLPGGPHGVHLHAVGTCTGPDFASAGPHFNPASVHHGLNNPDGPHAGDLPNMIVSAEGKIDVDLTDPRVTLDTSPNGGLFDSDGTAIVIHAAQDDQKSDPSGNSGARIACGVIEKRS